MTDTSSIPTIDRLKMSKGHGDNCALRKARESGRRWAEEVADYCDLMRLATLVETRNYLADLMQTDEQSGGNGGVQSSPEIQITPRRESYVCSGGHDASQSKYCTCFEEPLKPVMAAFVEGALGVWHEVKNKV